MSEVESRAFPRSTLADFLIGDLGPARRHLWRIKTGILPATPGVLDEIEASIERCVERINQELRQRDPLDIAREEFTRAVANLVFNLPVEVMDFSVDDAPPMQKLRAMVTSELARRGLHPPEPRS